MKRGTTPEATKPAELSGVRRHRAPIAAQPISATDTIAYSFDKCDGMMNVLVLNQLRVPIFTQYVFYYRQLIWSWLGLSLSYIIITAANKY